MKAVSNEVNRLKTEWFLYDFSRAFDFDLLNNVHIRDKAVHFLRLNQTQITEDVFRLLEPLPLSHRYLKPDWKNYHFNRYTVSYTDYLLDLSDIVAEYKAIEFVEPDIRKVAENYIDDYEKSTHINNFRTIVGLKAVEIASDVFKGNRYPVYCNPNCRERGFLKCKYMTDRSRSPEDCPKNSHIQKLKKEQKQRSTKGYVPEIAYLFAKVGILNVRECEYREEETCEKSPCLINKLKKCGQPINGLIRSKIQNLYPHLDSYLKELSLPISSVPKPACSIEKTKDISSYYQVCRKCKYHKYSEHIKTFIEFISRQKENGKHTHIGDATFKKELTILNDFVSSFSLPSTPLFNPCPKATEQIEKIIDENKHGKRRYVVRELKKERNKMDAPASKKQGTSEPYLFQKR